MVGKWHLSPHEQRDPGREEIDPSTSEGASRLEAQYEEDCRSIRDLGGFDFADGIYNTNINALNVPRELRYHNVEWQAQMAMKFVAENRNRPFFLYWATPIIHSPNGILSLQADPRITPKGYLDQPPLGARQRRRQLLDRLYTLGTIDPREDGAGYWESIYGSAAVSWLDEAVGDLLNELERLGLAENTIILVSSDNGYQRGKNSCYEAGTRVPCILRWPGRIKAGTVSSQLASNVDIAPTVLSACGAGNDADLRSDGTSLLPLLASPDQPVQDSIFNEVGYSRAVVTRDWKYIAIRYPFQVKRQFNSENRREFSHDGTRDVDHRFGAHVFYPGYFDRDQLYHLAVDSAEQQNLAEVSRGKERLKEMKDRMRGYCHRLPHSFGEFS
jgi:arylsulfatase A-like enzyme